MTRLHVHISVDDLDASTRFYSALFDQAPTVEKPDYAKWEVEDPRVNLSVSRRDGRVPGVNHLGIQAESSDELAILHGRLRAASVATTDEAGASCCYARSDKHWTADPQGVIWEMFHTLSGTPTYGTDHAPDMPAPDMPAPDTPAPDAPAPDSSVREALPSCC